MPIFSVETVSSVAHVWHALFLRRLKSHGDAQGRITLDINAELEKMLRRGEEIEWEQIVNVQAALQELTTARWTYTIEGDDTRIVCGPIWQIVDLVLTADEDWTIEDETTWCVASVTLQVGRWWLNSREVRGDAKKQIPLF